jgi:hypothetical protein
VSALQRLVDCSRNLCFFPFHVHPTGSAHWLGLKQRQRYRGTHRHSLRLYGSRLERTCTSRRGRDSSTTRGQLPSPTGHQFVSLSRFALDCGTTIEMKASKRSSFRFDAGITFVRYLQNLDPRQALVTSPTYIVTYGNFQVATSYVFRF